ncbi:MAG TPA: acyl-CoA dehydrogenase family protein [Aliidongia sp.]|uniref:acyl-CoA dehydrogenase family protein n=1 Tax=Aliidongia sp. TaxID=1914230 RepID=UPI002DDD7340|nr:acyl-CoA dehydrogenase family protein [Aliidongia sp.]HEV2674898.1 acyl-CoA dehydrogenase family protein [Aliidongia sp.]
MNSLLLRPAASLETAAAQRFAAATTLARDFAVGAAGHDREGTIPRANFQKLAAAGLLSLTVPARLGGAEADLGEVTRIVGRIATGDASTALILGMHYLHTATVYRSTRWPKPVADMIGLASAAGEVALINALRVEPELGSPARGGLPATTARRTADGWLLTGHKIYATGSSILRWGLVWARTDGEIPQVGFWLVPLNSPGVWIAETWDHLGMRATGSHEIVLTDVLVPAHHAVDLRRPAQWAQPDPVGLAWNTLVIAALYNGVAEAAKDWLAGYLNARVPSNLGASLATLPRIQETVGDIDRLLRINRRLIESASAEPTALGLIEPGQIKVTVTDNAVRVVERAMELAGNPGLSRANPLERHHRDVLCSRIHTPQSDSVLVAAGRAALGL